MTGKLDWRRAHQGKAYAPTRNEQRLERAADNWLETQTLYRKGPEQKQKSTKPKRKT